MSQKLIEYQEERFYSMARMSILLILTVISFVISPSLFPKIQLVQLVLGALTILSLLYHALITYRYQSFVMLRKNTLLLLDFVILTFLIDVLGEHGIYLLPLYAIIVMQSSVSYGLNYYVSGALIATASLAYLAVDSAYWKGHYEIIVAFGITTLLVPLFYIKTLVRMGRKIGEAEEKIAYIDQLEEQIGVPLANVADRESYKETIKNLVKKKETFTLLFIALQQLSEGEEAEKVNDTLLQEIVDNINDALDEEDFFARLSDSEFVIISRRQRVFLRKYLQKLEDTMRSTHILNGKSVHVEPNIGVALFPEDAQNEMVLGKCADEAMNAVKEKPQVHHMFYRGLTR
jgi:diguanylate cyclase (GGDEF)-like protein